MKAIHFREKETLLLDEVMQAIKGTLESLNKDRIHFGSLELNCPCINSGAPEHELHTIGEVEIYEGELSFDIDDQQLGYCAYEIPLGAAIEVLSQIEDLTEEDFED